MSRTIWLITESNKDAAIVRRYVQLRYPFIRVEALLPTGGSPNLSRLAAQLKRLIATARNRAGKGDCIAVLHDADELSRPTGREDYDKIAAICKQFAKQVKYVIAHDEIEAWLMADAGLCDWLGQKLVSHDHMKQPSKLLASWLDEAGKMKYREQKLPKLLDRLNGENLSPSLQAALKLLENAPCTRP